jgi:hypothetical protein
METTMTDKAACARADIQLADELLAACEEVIAGHGRANERVGGKIWRALRRAVWTPLFLFSYGVARMYLIFLAWIAGAIAGLLIATQVSRLLSLAEKDGANALLWLLGFALPTFLVLFSTPSGHALPGHESEHVSHVLTRLGGLRTLSREAVGVFRALVVRAEELSKQRVTALKWLVGVGWAIAIYLAQKGFDAKDGNLLGAALIPAALTLVVVGVIASYARALNAVYGLCHAALSQRELDALSHATGQASRAPRFRLQKRQVTSEGKRSRWP